MRKLVLLGLILFIVPFVMGAAPVNNSTVNALISVDTIDCQHTAPTWEFIDSMIVRLTDTADVIYTFTASVTLRPGQKLYLGFVDATGNAYTATSPPNVDTITYEWSAREHYSKSFNVGITFYDSLMSQDDRYDTIYVVGAVQGSTDWERVLLTNARLNCMVADKN